MYYTGTPEDIPTTFVALINGFPGSCVLVGVAVCKICIAVLWSPDSIITMEDECYDTIVLGIERYALR